MQHSRLVDREPRRRGDERRLVKDLLLDLHRARTALLNDGFMPPSRSPTPAEAPALGAVRQFSFPERVARPPRMETSQAKDDSVDAGVKRRPEDHEIERPSSQRLFRRRLAGLAADALARLKRDRIAQTSRSATESDLDLAIEKHWRRGLLVIALFAAGIGLWSVATPVSSAVVAAGQFVTEGNTKKIQHPTGGTVADLPVREGQRVSEGDLLIRLDETVTRVNLKVIVNQLAELRIRKARLEAERDGRLSPVIPSEFAERSDDVEIARVIDTETKLFAVRRAARDVQRAQLTRRIAHFQNEISGLLSQKDANAQEAEIIGQELVGVRQLYQKNLTPIMRLSTLERQAVSLNGQRGQIVASLAQAEVKISELEQQILQLTEDMRAETQKEIREVESKMLELSERRIAAEDQLKRIEIKAPVSGHVHQLAVHTVGGVISPGEPAMLIVPLGEELVIEAKVTPQDRDRVNSGQSAGVRLNTSERRRLPELRGTVVHVSADAAKEAGGGAFFTARVAVPKQELDRVRSVQIAPGMQAEVFIESGSRTLVEYLLGPLLDQSARAFRER